MPSATPIISRSPGARAPRRAKISPNGSRGRASNSPATGRITLVTLPRVFGYIFNPVSFYFCHDAAGAPLCAVVEVGNTFGEMKPYLLREPAGGRIASASSRPSTSTSRRFPPLDLIFDFKLRVPGEQLDIHIDDREGDRPVLLSALTGQRAPLTAGAALVVHAQVSAHHAADRLPHPLACAAALAQARAVASQGRQPETCSAMSCVPIPPSPSKRHERNRHSSALLTARSPRPPLPRPGLYQRLVLSKRWRR